MTTADDRIKYGPHRIESTADTADDSKLEPTPRTDACDERAEVALREAVKGGSRL